MLDIMWRDRMFDEDNESWLTTVYFGWALCIALQWSIGIFKSWHYMIT